MKVRVTKNKFNHRRNSQGASMIVVAIAAGFLIILLFIVFQFLTLTSGSREVRNAVDAAALNVSKRVGELRVKLDDQFNDVGDSCGQVSIANINRVWGKAYLINANAEAMTKEGTTNQYTAQNADEAYRMAQTANDRLVNSITDKATLDNFFNEMAKLRGAKLLGANSEMKTVDGPGWDVAMVDRGAPSNLKFDTKQIPKGGTAPPESAEHVSGYKPFNANNKTFTFASFIPNEMPHLTTDGNFNANDRRVSPLAGNPVPNAFRANGVNLSSKTALSASASSVANPRREYRLAIPHGYIKIIIQNAALWIVDGKQVAITSYKFEPETQHGIKGHKLSKGRILNGYASLGNEYKQGVMSQALQALPGNHQEEFERMLQRIKEIKHDFTMQELMTMLQKMPTAGTYVIYPTYSSPDLTDPKIQMVAVQPGEQLPVAWMNSAIQMDGTDKLIVDEAAQKDEPNYCWAQIIGGNPDCEKWTLVSGKIAWMPGTGYSPCLGVLKVARVTVVNYKTE